MAEMPDSPKTTHEIWLFWMWVHIWQVIKVILGWFLPENHLKVTMVVSNMLLQHFCHALYWPERLCSEAEGQ